MYINLGELCYQPEGSLFFFIIIICFVRLIMAVELLVTNVC
jgi:hypothetical protein